MPLRKLGPLAEALASLLWLRLQDALVLALISLGAWLALVQGLAAGAALLVGGACAVAGALVFWAWATPAGSVAGLALLGLGVSVVYPMCLSLAIGAAPPNLAAPATTRAAVGASLAILAAPFVLGALADAVGPRRAFGLVPALAVVALMLVAGGRRGAR